MIDARSPYRIGAVFLAVSAVLHLLAPVMSGFAGQGPSLAVIGVIYLAAAYGLMQGMRWLAYVMFIVLMIGSVAALLGVWANGAVPGWIFAGIVVANWLAVLALFGALWRSKPVQVAAA